MADSWVDAGNETRLVPGQKYRLRFYVRVPYTTLNVQLLKVAAGGKLFGKPVHVDGYDHAAPMASAHGGITPWPFVVHFTALEPPDLQAGLDPRGLVALAGLIAIAGLTLYITSTKIERLVAGASDAVNQPLQTALNPAVLILAVVGLYLYTRRH